MKSAASPRSCTASTARAIPATSAGRIVACDVRVELAQPDHAPTAEHRGRERAEHRDRQRARDLPGVCAAKSAPPTTAADPHSGYRDAPNGSVSSAISSSAAPIEQPRGRPADERTGERRRDERPRDHRLRKAHHVETEQRAEQRDGENVGDEHPIIRRPS